MFGNYFLSFHQVPFHTVDCVFYDIFLFFGASLVAQLVRNPPAMQETPVRFLGWEDYLERE